MVREHKLRRQRQGWIETKKTTKRMKEKFGDVLADFAETTTAHAPPKVSRLFSLQSLFKLN